MNPQAAAPPPAQVTTEPDLNIVKVDRPEQFPAVAAGQRKERPELQVTGVVNADVEKSLPVISLASGRVVGIYAKLGDDVRKGQLLLKVMSNDISNAFQTYQQAKADEVLAHKQLERAQLLYDRGAISLNDLQVAQDTEEKAAVSVTAALQMLRNLGRRSGSSRSGNQHIRACVRDHCRAECGGFLRRSHARQSAESLHHRQSRNRLGGLQRLRKLAPRRQGR